jgi:hypothetical protein
LLVRVCPRSLTRIRRYHVHDCIIKSKQGPFRLISERQHICACGCQNSRIPFQCILKRAVSRNPKLISIVADDVVSLAGFTDLMRKRRGPNILLEVGGVIVDDLYVIIQP